LIGGVVHGRDARATQGAGPFRPGWLVVGVDRSSESGRALPLTRSRLTLV
jgi:hypothetical protein